MPGYRFLSLMNTRLGPVCCIFTFFVLAAWPAPVKSDEITNLAEKLTAMRGDVESLENKLELKQQKLKKDLDSLAQQKADLEMQIEKERLRIKELASAMNRRKEDIEKYSVSGEDLKPLLFSAVDDTRAYVESALPFKTPERLAELAKIETQIKTGVMRPEKSAMMLWAFLEDEFRLTRESGLDRQIITVNGYEQLADVARIGMIMMFFQTKGGLTGKAVKEAGAWKYEVLTDSPDAEKVAYLFDSFKKQIRVGYFELPNALPDPGEK